MKKLSWPTHYRGIEKRQQILEFLEESPNATIAEIATAVGLSTDQVRRHRKTLIAEGLWPTALSSEPNVAVSS